MEVAIREDQSPTLSLDKNDLREVPLIFWDGKIKPKYILLILSSIYYNLERGFPMPRIIRVLPHDNISTPVFSKKSSLTGEIFIYNNVETELGFKDLAKIIRL